MAAASIQVQSAFGISFIAISAWSSD